MIYRIAAAIVAIALIAAYWLHSGPVFQVPITQARHILVETGLPPDVFGTEEPAWEVRDDGSQVTWIVRRDDAEIFRYVAHLKQQDPGSTRVEVELVGAQSGPGGNVAQRLAEHPEIKEMYLVAINERIASALEHRPFDIKRVYPATAVAFVENIGAFLSSMDEMAAASERLERENIRKAYRDEAEGR